MARTRQALLLLVALCLTGVGVGVRGQAWMCATMDRCFRDFKEQATRLDHIKEDYCRLLKEKLRCYNTARASCPPDLLVSAQRQIQSAQTEQKQACGAGWIRVSHWLMALPAILAMLFHRHL